MKIWSKSLKKHELLSHFHGLVNISRHITTCNFHAYKPICFILTPQPNVEPLRTCCKNEQNRSRNMELSAWSSRDFFPWAGKRQSSPLCDWPIMFEKVAIIITFVIMMMKSIGRIVGVLFVIVRVRLATQALIAFIATTAMANTAEFAIPNQWWWQCLEMG